MMFVVGAAVKFFGTPVGRYVAIALVAGLAFFAIRQSGYNAAQRACDAAALRSQLAAVRIDLDTATKRADRAERVAAELATGDAQAQERISELQRDVERLSLQSTKTGAKHDPNALLDDRCHYTDRGARRLR